MHKKGNAKQKPTTRKAIELTEAEFEAAYVTLQKLGLNLQGKRAQTCQEFIAYATYLQNEVKPQSYLEIGSRYGESLYLHALVLPKGAKIRAIELPEAGWGRFGSADVLVGVRNYLVGLGFDLDIFLGNSQDPVAIEWAKLNGPYDLVLIDGDHSFEGAKADWENYGQYAKYAVFHDAASIHDVGQVWQALKEKRMHVPHREFVYRQGRYTMGLGVMENCNAKK